MDKISNNQTIGLLIISILIAALIVRIVYVMFDGIRVLVEEIFDDDNNLPFDRSSYYIMNAVLVTCLCLFCLILIYEGYIVGYIQKLPDKQVTDVNPSLVGITPMTIDIGHDMNSEHNSH